jgi:hypothetical protein
MTNYLFILATLGTVLSFVGLYIKFKFQNNFEKGSEGYKFYRTLNYIFLSIGIVFISFGIILDPYETFPVTKKWSQFILAGIIYIFISFILPEKIQRKINKIYYKKKGLRWIAHENTFKRIYISIVIVTPIAIGLLYAIFLYFKIFIGFTEAIDQFLNVFMSTDNNRFIFLLWGIFFPIAVAVLYVTLLKEFIIILFPLITIVLLWEYVFKDMPTFIKIIYIIFSLVAYIFLIGLTVHFSV